MPSVRRKYSVTVCPILPENVTRNVDDVVTVEHGPLTLNETQTLVAYVPSGFFTVPVKLIACGVAVVVGFGVGDGVGGVVAGGAVVGRGVAGRWVAVGAAASVGVGGTTLGGAVGDGVGLGDGESVGAASTASGATGRFCWTMRSV